MLQEAWTRRVMRIAARVRCSVGRRMAVAVSVSVGLLAPAAEAAAQAPQPPRAVPVATAPAPISTLRLPSGLWEAAGPVSGGRQAPPPARDSLMNGAVIGAVIGAAALGTLAALVCGLEHQPDGPSCVPDVLRVGGIGAAIGAGAGLAIDAALTRHGGVRLSVRLPF